MLHGESVTQTIRAQIVDFGPHAGSGETLLNRFHPFTLVVCEEPLSRRQIFNENGEDVLCYEIELDFIQLRCVAQRIC